MSYDRSTVEAVVQHYFDALYEGDANKLEELLADHPHEKTISLLAIFVSHPEDVTADVDGNFDKRGLPDPLVLAFYFTPHNDVIIELIILRNRRDI